MKAIAPRVKCYLEKSPRLNITKVQISDTTTREESLCIDFMQTLIAGTVLHEYSRKIAEQKIFGRLMNKVNGPVFDFKQQPSAIFD